MSEIQFYRPTGKSVWYGKDLAKSTEWTYQFTSAALAEIDRNLTEVKKRGAKIEEITKADFPLTAMAEDMKALIQEVAKGRGFVVMRGLPRDKYSDEDLGLIYWGVGAHFGRPIIQSHQGDRLGHIMDLSDEEPDPTRRRAYHSGGPQHTHTDASDIVSMLSLQAAKTGGCSRLASAHTVHNVMMDTCPGLLRQMYEGFLLREPDSDAAAAQRPPLSPYRVPAYTVQGDLLDCYYVGGFVDRGVRAGDFTLTPVEQAAKDAFAAISNHPDIYLDMHLAPGDMQFFNNRSVLHGREAFEDFPEKERRRHLLRLWLKVPEWKPIDARQGRYSSDELTRNWEASAQKHRAAAAE